MDFVLWAAMKETRLFGIFLGKIIKGKIIFGSLWSVNRIECENEIAHGVC